MSHDLTAVWRTDKNGNRKAVRKKKRRIWYPRNLEKNVFPEGGGN